jgi:hypothetical protein
MPRRVAIEGQGWRTRGKKSSTDAPFRRLTPTRMVHGRIDVGVETIFVRRGDIPAITGLTFGEANFDDRLDILEAVFPRRHQAQRRAVLIGEPASIDPDHQHRQRVHCLVDTQAFDIGPLQDRYALAWHLAAIQQGCELDILRVGSRLESLQQRA